jgi:hypothetical protein
MFGDLTSQIEFAKRHKLLIDNIPNLKTLADTALSDCDKSSFESMTLYTLARVAMEDDFWSIILLCSNGYAHSAKQVLRGMFERVVTFAYLAKHPDEISLFNDFFRVDQRKRLRYYERNNPGKFSAEFMEQVDKDYEEVKENYMITDCKKCKTKRVNHMWSKKGLVAMAEEVGFSFKTIDAAYYTGLEEAHPKIDALFSRTKEEADGSVTYDERPSIEKSDGTVMTAAILQMKIFAVLKEHFKLETMNEPFGPYLVGLAKYVEFMTGSSGLG